MPRFIDLTHPLVNGAPAFPNDPKMAIVQHGTIDTHGYNITQLLTGSHQDTHADALSHFIADGLTIDAMPLEWFHGPACRIDLPRAAGSTIGADDLRAHEADIGAGARLIVNTGWHRLHGTKAFFQDFPSLTIDAAEYLVSRRIRLLGLDVPTPGKDWYRLHHILLARDAEVVIVEGLVNLDALPKTFVFSGFPLRIRDGDGSPIRAVALCVD